MYNFKLINYNIMKKLFVALMTVFMLAGFNGSNVKAMNPVTQNNAPASDSRAFVLMQMANAYNVATAELNKAKNSNDVINAMECLLFDCLGAKAVNSEAWNAIDNMTEEEATGKYSAEAAAFQKAMVDCQTVFKAKVAAFEMTPQQKQKLGQVMARMDLEEEVPSYSIKSMGDFFLVIADVQNRCSDKVERANDAEQLITAVNELASTMGALNNYVMHDPESITANGNPDNFNAEGRKYAASTERMRVVLNKKGSQIPFTQEQQLRLGQALQRMAGAAQ